MNDIGGRRLAGLVCLILAGWTLLVYWPSLDGEFLRYDEEAYVTKNPIVQRGLSPETVAWAMSLDPSTIYWHPLTWLSHMLDVQLFGLNPFGHHLGSLLLHVMSTALLFLVLLRMTRDLWPSAAVAALFSIHPLHVESVCWIAERKDVLSAFFWMLTLGAYALYAEKPGIFRYLTVIVCYALGLMSKPMLVTLPFVLVLLDNWPLRRLSPGSWPKLVLEKLPLFLMAILSTIVTFAVQKDIGAVSRLEELSLWIRIGNAVVSYGAYIGKTLLPVRLAAFYPHPGLELEIWRVGLGGAVIVALSGIVIRQHRRGYLTTGWLWYLGTLVPVIGIVQAGDQAMADRFTYIPLIGLFVMMAWGVRDTIGRRSRTRTRKLWLGSTALLFLLGLTGLTSIQIGYWQNSISLWKHTLAVTDRNYFAHNNLGQAYNDAGRYEEAAEQYGAAIPLNPAWAEGYTNLGNALAKLGRHDEALAQFRTALEKKKAQTGGVGDEVTAVIHCSMGLTLADAGRGNEAMEHFQEAVSIKPDLVPARYGLAKQLHKIGKYTQAIEHYREVLRFDPRMVPAQNDLAVALYFTGDYAGAWQAVAGCRALGYEPAPGFLEALSRKMTEPGGR